MPDFAWIGAGGKTLPAQKFARAAIGDPRGTFARREGLRQEAGRIQDLYLQFSARKTLFLAAFTSGQNGRVASNVPYAIAATARRLRYCTG